MRYRLKIVRPDTSRKPSKRLLAAVAGVLLCISGAVIEVVLASAYFGESYTSSYNKIEPCRSASQQSAYQCAIIQDRDALQLGYVSLDNTIDIALGHSYAFAVTVCGSRVHYCGTTHTAEELARPEPAPLEGNIKVGAYLRATLLGGIPGTVQSMSAAVEPVITSSDSATWIWEITPSQAGTFELALTVTPLLANTDTPLVAGATFPIKVSVTANSEQQASTILSRIGKSAQALGGIFGALGVTIAGTVTWLYRRMRKRRELQSNATSAQVHDDEINVRDGGSPDSRSADRVSVHDSSDERKMHRRKMRRHPEANTGADTRRADEPEAGQRV